MPIEWLEYILKSKALCLWTDMWVYLPLTWILLLSLVWWCILCFSLYSGLTRTRHWLSFPYGRSNGPGAKHTKTYLLRHCWSMVTKGSIYQRSGKSSLYLYNLLHPLLSSRPPSSRTRHWSFWSMALTNSLKILIRWVMPFMPCCHNCTTYLKLAKIWTEECSSCWSGCKIGRLSARLRLMNTFDSSAST